MVMYLSLFCSEVVRVVPGVC